MRTTAIFPRIAIACCFLAGALVSRVDAADVRVEAIMVKPASPAPSALCELKVLLKNSGSHSASYFRFEVKVADKSLPVYKVYTYAIPIDPGASSELALFNFYSPAEGKTFEVQVTLLEAQWVDVKKEGKSSTTTPAGAVAGLPTGNSLLVKLAPPKS